MTNPLTADHDLASLAAGGPVTDRVRGAFVHLAERFRPADAAGVEGVWVVDVDGHQPYSIHVQRGRCLVSPGAAQEPVASLHTDGSTWVDMVDGRLDGLRAFTSGRLQVRGDLSMAVRLETMFTPGPEATRLVRATRTSVKGLEIDALVAGHGIPVVLIHGLGANKLSFIPTLDGLADGYEVHAIDLPGFGRSSKPLPGGRRYSAAWFADIVDAYLRAHRIRSAYLVGNSMGGRVATEVALRHPRRVRGIVGLGSAVAFDEWQPLSRVLKLVRYEWAGMLPVRPPAAWIEAGMTELFHDPSRVPAANMRAGADDVARSARDRGYRMAVASAARHLAAERGLGRNGYWTRLAELQLPSLWIWGRQDRLVSHRYAEKVGETLPHARVEVWDGVGHVPQFEVPERTNEAVTRFIARTRRAHPAAAAAS